MTTMTIPKILRCSELMWTNGPVRSISKRKNNSSKSLAIPTIYNENLALGETRRNDGNLTEHLYEPEMCSLKNDVVSNFVNRLKYSQFADVPYRFLLLSTVVCFSLPLFFLFSLKPAVAHFFGLVCFPVFVPGALCVAVHFSLIA